MQDAPSLKTKNKNIYPCASAAKPGSGRHAVRQAKMSRAKEEGKEERSECGAKGGKAKRSETAVVRTEETRR